MSNEEPGCLAAIIGGIGMLMFFGGIIASFTGVGVILGGPIAIIGYKMAEATLKK